MKVVESQHPFICCLLNSKGLQYEVFRLADVREYATRMLLLLGDPHIQFWNEASVKLSRSPLPHRSMSGEAKSSSAARAELRQLGGRQTGPYHGGKRDVRGVSGLGRLLCFPEKDKTEASCQDLGASKMASWKQGSSTASKVRSTVVARDAKAFPTPPAV